LICPTSYAPVAEKHHGAACGVEKEQADSLPRGSAERKTLEKHISNLEQYPLPKEDERDAGQREDVFDESGKKMRKRTIERRRGRPEEFTIKTRAAYEEKSAHPESFGR